MLCVYELCMCGSVHTYYVMCTSIPDWHMYISVSMSVGIHTGMCECVGMCTSVR